MTPTLSICNIYCISRHQSLRNSSNSYFIGTVSLLFNVMFHCCAHPQYVLGTCTVSHNEQQSADTAVLSGKCSAVWDAASLQYTCTESSVSVHVHHQVQHTRARENTFCGNIVYFLKKWLENFWFKNVERNVTGRKKNKCQSTPWIRELWWRVLVWEFGSEGIKG